MRALLLIAACLGYAKCWPGYLEENPTCGLAESISLFDKPVSNRDNSLKAELTFMTEFARFMNYKAAHLLQEFAERKKIYETKEKLRILKFQTNLLKNLGRNQRPKRSSKIEGRQDIVDTVSDAVDDTADAAIVVAEDVGDVAMDVVEGTGDLVETGIDAAGDVADEVVDAASGVIDGFGAAGGNVIDAVTGAGGDAGEAVGELGQAAGELAQGVINAVTNSTTGLIDIFTDIVQSVGDVLEESLPPSVWEPLCLATWWPYHGEHCNTARCVACSPAITTSAAVCRRAGKEVTNKCVQDVMGEGFCNYCINEYLVQ